MFRVNHNSVILILLAYSFVGIAFIYYGDKSQYSDAQTYIERVNYCFEQNILYPDKSNINDDYINAPGYVNFLVFMAKIFGNNIYVFASLNLICITLTGLLIYKIILPLSNTKFAIGGMLIYLLYLTNLGYVLVTLSEPLFVLLLLSYLYFRGSLTLQNKQIDIANLIVLSINLYLLNYVKPFAIIILAAEFLLLLSNINRATVLNLTKLTVAYLVINTTTTFLISLKTDIYVPQSVSLGYNLVLGSSPIADGSYVDGTFDPGNYGHIINQQNISFTTKDSIWKKRALEWAMSNPLEWLLLVPKKIFYTFSADFFTMHKVIFSDENSIETKEYITNWINRFPTRWIYKDYLLLFNQLIYISIVASFIISILSYKLKVWKLNTYFVILIVLLYAGMISIILGGSRYHYPLVPLGIIISIITFYETYSKKSKEISHL